MSEREVRCIIYQCLLGLNYLHERNIIHRDIKPENVLIDKQTKQVRITDFGLSKFVADGEMTAYVSTRWYRAPEMLLRHPHYSKPADVFALGCVMAELLLSRELFDGHDAVDQLHKICRVLGRPTQA
jgi:serine/threonine protein kinase